MRKRPWQRVSPSMAVALLALFVALGGVGYSATGGAFILGHKNHAGKTSRLVSGSKKGPTLIVSNSANKPAARFVTKAGVAPFSVSNGTKIAKLNADRLDGNSSGAFVKRCAVGSVAAAGNWYAPSLPGNPTYAAPNRSGGEDGFACNGGTIKATKVATGWFRIKVDPKLPGQDRDANYVLFVNPDPQAATPLFANGISEVAGGWDVYVYDKNGAPADPYYLEVAIINIRR